MIPVLSITGSDNAGWSGLQLDLRIIAEMGGHALSSATCIVMQDHKEIREMINFPPDVIRKQISAIVADFHPKAVKVGLIRTPEAVKAVAEEIVGCRRVVLAPGIMSSNGTQLIDDDTIDAIRYYLIPQASLLVLRQTEVEKLLGTTISSDDDMLKAAEELLTMGAEAVLLRGGNIVEGRLTALLRTKETSEFFSSYNIEGWQQHGVGGALSAAITTRMAIGDDVESAIDKAHEFVHSRIVYSVSADSRRLRPSDIYNEFMNLLSDNYKEAHDVAFYADKLNITSRYLSQITGETVSKTPKQIINEYLLRESRRLLENRRLSIKEISDLLGFSSTTVFCKTFKHQMGFTPSEYRSSVGSL